MRKSMWIELVEWAVLALIIIFLSGVFLMRDEIQSSVEEAMPPPASVETPGR